jgi:Co/Zn/Cd efflux system component
MPSLSTENCGCGPQAADTAAQQRVLKLALTLNVTMFVVGLVAGLVGQSSGLIADSLDMLADASAYAIALLAVHRGELFKARAARSSGVLLILLGVGVLVDVARRSLLGHAPEGGVMIAVASVSLLVNVSVLRLLGRVRNEGVHLNATWIFTRVDVIANLGVIVSGVVVALTSFRAADMIVGAAIGLYVVKEAVEIIKEASEAGEAARAASGKV